MKKTIRKMVIICVVLLVIGAATLGTGLLGGGSLEFCIYPLAQKVETAADSDSYVKDTVAVDAFDTLTIDASIADVEIQTGDAFQVQYCLVQGEEPAIAVKDGVLSVVEKNSRQNEMVFSLGGMKKSDRITITIPKTAAMKVATVKVDSADVKISQIQFDNVELESDCGDVHLSNIQMKSCRIVCEDGDVKLTDCTVDSGSLNLENGDVKVTNSTLDSASLNLEDGDVKFTDSTLGSADLNMENGDTDVQNVTFDELQLKSEDGDLKLERISASNMEITTEMGDVKLKDSSVDCLEAKSGAGDINVQLNGTLDDYDLTVAADAGDFTLNGKEQASSYTATENKQKQIAITTKYGDVKLRIQ